MSPLALLPLVLGILGVPGTPPPEADPLQDICKDVRRIQEDEGLFDQYYRCLVDTGPCTKDSKRLKDVIEEALQRGCARCSAAQRHAANTLLELAVECRPGQYRELEKRLDPEGVFRREYKKRRGSPVPMLLEGGVKESPQDRIP